MIDGKVHSFDNLLDVIVKNTQIFGGEWIFDPNTESDDGLFELVPVAGRRDFGTKLLGSLRRSPVGIEDLALLGFEHAPADRRRQVRARRARRTAAAGRAVSTARSCRPATATGSRSCRARCA